MSNRVEQRSPGLGLGLLGVVALGATIVAAWSLWQPEADPYPLRAVEALLFALLMAAAWRFPIRFGGGAAGRHSLDAAILLTAAATLPVKPLLLAALLAPIAGEIASRPRRKNLWDRVGWMGLNGASVLGTLVAQRWVFGLEIAKATTASRFSFQLVIVVLAALVAGMLINQVVVALGLAAEGKGPAIVVREYVRLAVPWDLLQVPVAGVLILVRLHLGVEAFVVLALLFLGGVILVHSLLEARGEREDKLQEFEVLHRVGRAISRSLNRDQVCEAIQQGVHETFSPSVTNLVLVDRRTGEWSLALRWEQGQRTLMVRPERDSDPVEWVMRHRRSLYIPDLEGEMSAEVQPNLQGEGVRSLIVHPLVVDDELLGVLAMQSQKVDAFRPSRRRLFAALTEHVSYSMANAIDFERATQDGVSGLALRDYFHRMLHDESEVARRYDRPYSVMVVDIHRFRAINERFGHEAGDRLLRALGRTLTRVLRTTDLLARMEADVCAVLLRETGRRGALRSAERVLAAAEKLHFKAGSEELRIEIAVGIAAFDHNRDSEAIQVLQRAEKAMKAAKEQGGNVSIAAWEKKTPSAGTSPARV